MNIIFLGTPEFAIPSLRMLLCEGFDVLAVVTQPDRPQGRGKAVSEPPIKPVARELNVPVLQFERIRAKESRDALAALRPDLFITAAYGQILSQRVLDIPKLGTVNVHGSLLPRHRGAAPVQWSILCGDTMTGVTTMYTDVGVDTGDMLLSDETPIGPEETGAELYDRLALLGAGTLQRTLNALQQGTLKRIPQADSPIGPTHEPMLTRRHGLIDWTRAAQDIHNQVRGLFPWPGAYTYTSEGMQLKLHRARMIPGCGRPGEVVVSSPKDGLIVAAGSGALEIIQLQCPGSKAMEAAAYLRGHPLPIGTLLGGNDER